MRGEQKKRKLSEKEKRIIWTKIFLNYQPDDRDPLVVIKEKYKGDEEAYLYDMKMYLEGEEEE